MPDIALFFHNFNLKIMLIGNFKVSVQNIITITDAVTLSLSDLYVIAMGAVGYTITLPTNPPLGKIYSIKCRNATKFASVAYYQGGNLTNQFNVGTVVYLVWDGANWQQF